MPRATDRLGQGEALVGVGHDVPGRADGVAYRAQARHVFCDVRPADLDLGAAEALGLCRERVVDQRSGLEMKPSSFGRV